MCEQCGMKFHRNLELKNHMQDHFGKNFQCPQCPKQFKRKCHLKDHIDVSNNFIIYLQSGAVSLGVVSWTCDPVLALGQRFDSHSRRFFYCNPLSKGFAVHYLVFSDWTWKTGGPVSVHISLHILKIPSNSSKKSRPLWPVMMDDSAPIERR